MLRGGRILQGKVTRFGDQYIVTFSNGGEIRIPTRTVDYHCKDLLEAYRRKDSTIQPGSVRERLNLAQWCISQRLYIQADDQIRQLASIDPRNSQVQRLADHLRALQTRTSDPSAPNPSKNDHYVSDDELDRLINELPGDAIEQFTTTIQPILVNRCGASGCHGTNTASAFRLIRTSGGRVLARRITTRNLYATMQQVRIEDPGNSPLLRSPAAAHGTAAKSVFGQYDRRQYERLVEWVRTATTRNEPQTPKTIARRDADLLQAKAIERPRFSRTSSAPFTFNSQNLEDRSQNSNKLDSYEHVESNEGPTKRKSAGGFVPVDPFDPEIFNRRFFGGEIASKSETQTKQSKPHSPSSDNSSHSSASRK